MVRLLRVVGGLVAVALGIGLVLVGVMSMGDGTIIIVPGFLLAGLGVLLAVAAVKRPSERRDA